MRCKCGRFSKTKYCCSKCSPSKTDDFSKFRRHLTAAKYRSRKKKISINIDLKDLEYIWNKQKGKCPYTKWNLINYDSAGKGRSRFGERMRFASLDRKDSSKGYVRGNIQFISYIAQLAKSDFTEEQFLEFCKAIKC